MVTMLFSFTSAVSEACVARNLADNTESKNAISLLLSLNKLSLRLVKFCLEICFISSKPFILGLSAIILYLCDFVSIFVYALLMTFLRMHSEIIFEALSSMLDV